MNNFDAQTLDDDKIVIVGSRSYIGNYLSHYLRAQGKDVLLCSSDQCDLLNIISIREYFDSLGNEKFRFIFLAAIVRETGDSFEGFLQNLHLVQNFVQHADKDKISSFIYFSTVDVYGNSPPKLITENSPVAPDNWYGLAKLDCEWIVDHYFKSHIPVTLLRIPGIYGPTPREKSIIRKLITRIQDKGQVTIFGQGTSLRDYVFIGDLTRVIASILGHPGLGILNVATGKSVSVSRIVQVLQDQMDTPFEVIYDQVSDNGQREFDLVFDTTKLKAVLGDFQFLGIEGGIKMYLQSKPLVA